MLRFAWDLRAELNELKAYLATRLAKSLLLEDCTDLRSALSLEAAASVDTELCCGEWLVAVPERVATQVLVKENANSKTLEKKIQTF